MFGGDNTAPDGQNNGAHLDDTLKGVEDLAASMAQGPGSAVAQSPASDSGMMGAPAEPAASDAPTPAASTDAPAEPPADLPIVPSSEEGTVDANPTPAADMPATDSAATADSGDLLDLKQQALQQLSPLVGHLDQSPEEKFRTTMMLIQASDNQSLLKEAFEAAQAIADDKVRAQALLDVINEINYFTQKSGDK